jgi:hypothetical protein
MMSLPEHTSALHPTADAGLPQEKLPKVSARKFWRDLLLALSLLAFFNISSYLFLGHYTSNYGFWVIKNKWRLLLDQDTPVDWLILGDSSVNQGVIPSVIEAEIGKTALNLGTIGNMTLVDDLWMLEEYIGRFGPPQKVAIIHVFDVWHRSFNPMLLAHVPLPWGFWENYSLSEELIQEEAEKDLFIERFAPLYTQNRTLRQNIYATLTNLRSPFDTGYRLDEDGYFPAQDPAPARVILGAEDQINFTRENGFFISYTNQMLLEDLIRMAENYQMDIYLMNSPIYEGLYHAPAFEAYTRNMHTALENIAQTSPYFHYIPEMKTFTAEQMQNPDHLITAGAEIYTRWLVNELENDK